MNKNEPKIKINKYFIVSLIVNLLSVVSILLILMRYQNEAFFDLSDEIKRLQVIADIREDYYFQILEAEITAYTSSKEECGRWHDGFVKAMIRVEDLKWAPLGIVAVDPKIIPLGSLIILPSKGVYLACDTGRVIIGNKLDILMTSKKKALSWGKRKEKIAILRKVKAY